MTLGEQIKQARELKNLSQEELAEQLGVSRQAVSKWENNTSLPHGANRELLSEILELEFGDIETIPRKTNIFTWLGWGVAAILLIVVVGMGIYQKTKTSKGEDFLNVKNQESVIDEPVLKSIKFYDSKQNEVEAEALWYNTAWIESILLQWENGSPNDIKIFFTPSGTETLDKTELLLTKSVLDGDKVELISAETLKGISQGHVYFELNFGEDIVVSELYNMFFDPNPIVE